MPFTNQDIPRRYFLNHDFDRHKEHEIDYFFRKEKERNFNLSYLGATGIYDSIFGTNLIPNEMMPDVSPEALKDEASYQRQPKRLDLYGQTMSNVAKGLGYGEAAQYGFEWMGDILGFMEASSNFLLQGALDGWSGWVGNDTAGYALRRGILVDGEIGDPYANIPSTGTERPVDKDMEGRFNTLYLGDIYSKFKQLFDNAGAIGNFVNGGSPYRDIQDSLNYAETDPNYISKIDGSFDSIKYFEDNYGDNARLLSVLNRNGFNIEELTKAKNKRTADYLVGRAVTRSSLESTLESYYENSAVGQTGMMIYSLPSMIYNDPDMAATLGLGGLAGLIKGVGKGLVTQTLKGVGKQALRNSARETFRKSLGTRVAKLFHNAGKGSAFARYAAAGFRVEKAGFKQIADSFLKLGTAGALQGGLSDILSQKAMIEEARILGATTEREKEFDYARFALATSLGFVLGGALGSIPAIAKAMKKSNNKSNQQITSALAITDEAGLGVGSRFVSNRPLFEEMNANRAANNAEARERVRNTKTEDDPRVDAETKTRVSPDQKEVKLDRMTESAVARQDPETGRFAMMDAEMEAGIQFREVMRTKDAAKMKKLAESLGRVIKAIENKVKKSGKELSEEDRAFLNKLVAQENMFRRRLGMKEREVPSTESVKTTDKRQGARKAYAPLNTEEKARIDAKVKNNKASKRKSRMSKAERKKASRAMQDDKFFAGLSPEHAKVLELFNTLVGMGVLKPDAALVLRSILANQNPRYLRNIRYREETGDLIVTRPADETSGLSRSSQELQEDLLGTFAEVESRGEDGSVELILNLNEIKKASSVEQVGVFLHEIAGHVFHEDLPIHLQKKILDEYNNMTPDEVEVFKNILRALGADERQVAHAMSDPYEFFAELTRIVLTDRYDRAGVFDEAHNITMGLDAGSQYRILELIDSIYSFVVEKARTLVQNVLDVIRSTQEELDGGYRDLNARQERQMEIMEKLRESIEEDYLASLELDTYQSLSGTVIKNKLKRALTDYPLSKAIRDDIESHSRGAEERVKIFREDSDGTPTIKQREKLRQLENTTGDVFTKFIFYINDFLSSGPGSQKKLFLDNKTDVETFQNTITSYINELDQGTQSGKDLATYLTVRYLDPFEMFEYVLYVDKNGKPTKLSDLISQAAQIRSVIDPLRIDSEIIVASRTQKGNSLEANMDVLREVNFERRGVAKGLQIAFENSIDLGSELRGHPLTDMLDYGDFIDGTLSNALFLQERMKYPTLLNYKKGGEGAINQGIMSDVPASAIETARQYLHLRDRLARIEKGRDVDLRQNENFKEWFQKSKASHLDGTPMLLFHGTTAKEDFSYFDTNINTTDVGFYGKGIYFTSQANEANTYAGSGARKYGRVIPVYLSMQRPFILKSNEAFYEEISQFFDPNKPEMSFTESEYLLTLELLEGNIPESRIEKAKKVAKTVQDILKEQGYDGLIIEEGREYIVFESTQVKSAISNDGSYSRTEKVIRKAVAPENRDNIVPPAMDPEAAARIEKFNKLRNKEKVLFDPKSSLRLAEGHEDIASLPASKLEEMVLNGSLVVIDNKLQTKTKTILSAVKELVTEKTLNTIENLDNITPEAAVEAVSNNITNTAEAVTNQIGEAADKSTMRRTVSTQSKSKKLPESLVVDDSGNVDVVSFVSHTDSKGNPSVYDALIKSINGVVKNLQDAEDAAGEIIAQVMDGKITAKSDKTEGPKQLLSFLAGKGASLARSRFREEKGQFTEGGETKYRSLEFESAGVREAAEAMGSMSMRMTDVESGTMRGLEVSTAAKNRIDSMHKAGRLTDEEKFLLLQEWDFVINEKIYNRAKKEKERIQKKRSKLKAKGQVLSEEDAASLVEQTKIVSELKDRIAATPTALNRAFKKKFPQYKTLKKTQGDKLGTIDSIRESGKQKFVEEGTIDIDGETVAELVPESKPYDLEKAEAQMRQDGLQTSVEKIDINESQTKADLEESKASTGVSKINKQREEKAKETTVSSNDSKTTVINTRSIKTIRTGEPTTFTVHEASTSKKPTKKATVATTSKPKAEAVRKEADQNKETVIKTSEVILKNPVVATKPITKAEDLIDQIPDDLLLVEGIDTFILKVTIKNGLDTLRKLGFVKTLQDEYDFIMSYLNDQHGIDAVIHIDGEDATIVLPAEVSRRNTVNETHSATGKVETDGVKVDEDAAVPDEEGNTKPIDDEDEQVVDNGRDAADGPEVEEGEAHAHDTDDMSVQDQVDAFILSDNEFLNSLGADIQLVSKLISLFPRSMHSFQAVSKLVGGYLLQASEIMKKNSANHGDEAVVYFWKQVDSIRLKNDKQRQKIEAMETKTIADLLSVKTDKQIYELAAKKTNKKFNKDNKKPRFQEPLQPEEYDALTGGRKFESEAEKMKRAEEQAGKFDGKAKGAVRRWFNKKDGNNHRVVREQGWIGTVFGASDIDSQNWWRNTMRNVMLFAQYGTGLKDTMYSYIPLMQKLSRFVDDTRFHTGHIVGAGKRPIRTWMASKSKADRFIGILMTENARLLRISNRYNSYNSIMSYIFNSRASKKAIDKNEIKELLTESGVPANKINDAVEEIFEASVKYNKTLTLMFKKVFELQEETGWKDFISGSKKAPLDPETYVPITLDPNKVASHSDAIEMMTKARRNTIKNRETIHKSIAYALGWLPVDIKEGDAPSSLFGQGTDRTGNPVSNLRSSLERVIDTNFDAETIAMNEKIRTRTNPLDSLKANERLHGRIGRDWFLIKDGDDYVIVKMPKKLEELSVSDRAKYMKAVDGDASNYTPNMIDFLKSTKNQDIIMAEMSELLSWKLGQGIYSNSVISAKNYKPILGLGDPEGRSVGVRIQNITPEEVMEFPELKEILQTNSALSTIDFLHGRLFELLAQQELDRMLGTKGIRMYEFLRQSRQLGLEEISKARHSPELEEMLTSSLNAGMDKIEEMYSMYSGKLSRIDDKYNPTNTQLYTVASNLVQGSTAWGYGIAAGTETLAITANSGILSANPAKIISNTITLLRNVFGDLRYDRAADRMEVADTIFAFDILNRNMTVRFLSEMDQTVETSLSSAQNWFGPEGAGLPKSVLDSNSRIPQELAGRFAYFANQVGSLHQVTNANRMMAITKYTRMIQKHLESGRLIKLLDKMEEPENANKIKNLEQKASTDRKAQKELIKFLKDLARKEGLNYQDVVPFMQYGLLNREMIDSLNSALKAIEAKNGRIDFAKLRDLYVQARTNKSKTDVDPDVLEDAVDRFIYMSEQLVTLRDVSEPMGLSIQTGTVGRTTVGRLLNKLFSWVQSYQYGTIANFGGRTTLKYLVGTLTIYAVADLVNRTFREWLAGRDAEDIMKEVEKEPIRYISKAAAGVPLLGRFNGFLGLVINSIQTALGVDPTDTFNPFGAPGLSALPKYVDKVARASKTTAELITGRSEKEFAEISAEYAKLALLDGPVNKSPLGIPVRIFEELEAIDEGSSLKEFLDSIQRDAQPYQRKRGRYRKQNYDFSAPTDGIGLLEQRRMSEQRLENIDLYNKTEKPAQIDRIRQSVAEMQRESGESFERPQRPQRPKGTPKSTELGSGPSRASERLADVLQKKQKK